MLAQAMTPEIREMIQERNLKELREVLIDWPTPEISDLIEKLETPDDVTVFRLLPHELAIETFEYLEFEKQELLIEELAKEAPRQQPLLSGQWQLAKFPCGIGGV